VVHTLCVLAGAGRDGRDARSQLREKDPDKSVLITRVLYIYIILSREHNSLYNSNNVVSPNGAKDDVKASSSWYEVQRSAHVFFDIVTRILYIIPVYHIMHYTRVVIITV